MFYLLSIDYGYCNAAEQFLEVLLLDERDCLKFGTKYSDGF